MSNDQRLRRLASAGRFAVLACVAIAVACCDVADAQQQGDATSVNVDSGEGTRPEAGEANRDVIDTGAGSPDERSQPLLDWLWAQPNLYHNEDNSWIQDISLFGRYHGQYYDVDASQGSAHGWENRRLWAGMRATLLHDFTVAGNFNLNPDSNDSVATIDTESIDTATIAWHPNDNFQLLVGQQKAGFSYEYATSSNRMLTFERSLLVNQVVPDKTPGIVAQTRFGKFGLEVGGFSGEPLGSDSGEPLALFKVSYDLSEQSRFEKMGVQFHYLYNSAAINEGAEPYEHLYSLSTDYQQEANSALIELLYADGYERIGDSYGVTVMPARYVYQEKVQLVARYHYAASSDENGLRTQSRYESEVPLPSGMRGTGDSYHAGYFGVNWYLYGRKLKLMTGVEYSDLGGSSRSEGFSGWTWFSGVRMNF